MRYDELMQERADKMAVLADALEARAEACRAVAGQCDEARMAYTSSGRVIRIKSNPAIGGLNRG